MGVYNASKAAVRSLARTWTLELKERKIRINVLSPGPIDTATFDGVPQEAKDGLSSQVPMGRFGTAEEIAAPALFLASDDSRWLTGERILVSGGMR